MSYFNLLKILTFINCIIIILFIDNACAQTDSIIPGIVHIKFDQSTLLQLNQQLDTADIFIPEIRDVLKQYGYESARKIFNHSHSSDTLTTSLTGEQVHMVDISRWYTIKVNDSSNIKNLIKDLLDIPGVLAASQGHFIKQDETLPNDPRFTNGVPDNSLYARFTSRGYITSIRGSETNDIIIAGEHFTLLHFNGISWQQLGIPFDLQSNFQLYNVAMKENFIVAVGSLFDKAVAIRLRRDGFM